MRLLSFVILSLFSAAWAHTAVTSVTPGAFAIVTAPAAVQIKLNEPVDLHFATFKVYPLKVSGDKLALNRAAATLAKTALKARADEDLRADTWKKQTGTTSNVSIPLKQNLLSGAYVIMWRLLSGDGHVISGQSVFSVK